MKNPTLYGVGILFNFGFGYYDNSLTFLIKFGLHP